MRYLGLVVVRVAKLVVIALVVVGIDELVREGEGAHGIGYFARRLRHARGLSTGAGAAI